MLNNLICSCVTGQQEELKHTSGRIVMLTSYLTSLVLMAAYSTFLISILAVQHQHLPFRDLQGLLYDGSYRLGVMRDSLQFNLIYVCGRTYLWPDYLVVVDLALWKKLVKVWEHAVSIVLFSVITLKLTDFLSLSESQNLILQAVIPRWAALRTFYQRPYHNNCSHVQWYLTQLTSNLITTV